MVPFTLHMPFHDVLKRARADLEVWTNIRGDPKKSAWRDWAGESLTEMTKSPRATIRFLDDPDPRLRLAAATLLAEHWRPAEIIVAAALRLAFEDADPAVRGAGLFALVFLQEYVDDPNGTLIHLLRGVFPKLPKAALLEKRETLGSRAEHAARIQQRFAGIAEKLAGPYYSQMISNRESCESYLGHPDPKICCAALFTLGFQWPRTKQLGLVCEKLFLSDPDPEVRLNALTGLALCYSSTDDDRVGDLIARIVYDETRPSNLSN